MANVPYTNLGLKLNPEVKTFKIQGKTKELEIEVSQYLPIRDKYDLVMIVIQNAYEGGIYNPIKIEMYLHLYLVYLYSNLTFTENQKADEEKLYDTLNYSGIMNRIIELIPEEEYNEITKYIEDIIKDTKEKNSHISSLLTGLINDLPRQAEAMGDIINNFNPEKFQEVLNFAKAANGGRDIK